MAPVNKPSNEVVEDSIKQVIEDLYNAMVQVHAYDTGGRPGNEVLEVTLKTLSESIQAVNKTVNQPTTQLPSVPYDLIQYVDCGRNPDIYTRENVESVRKQNQLLKGKMEAFENFRDVLAREMARVMPELKEDLGNVVEKTGGNRAMVLEEEERK